MWIKTTDNNLINLNNVDSIYVKRIETMVEDIGFGVGRVFCKYAVMADEYKLFVSNNELAAKCKMRYIETCLDVIKMDKILP